MSTGRTSDRPPGAPPPPAPPGPPRFPVVLLALLSVLTLAGPFVIFGVIRGGTRPGWPPDRPLEWWILGGIVGLFSALMIATVGVALAALRDAQARLHGRTGLELDALDDPDHPALGVPRRDLDLHLDRSGPGTAPAAPGDLDLHLGQDRPDR